MAIIDILYGKFIPSIGGNGVADSNRNKFTVDHSVNSVDFDTTDTPNWFFIFQTDPGKYAFKSKDNIEILSVGLKLPYYFIEAEKMPVLEFSWVSSSSVGALAEIAPPSGRVILPFANYELNLGVYIPFPTVSPSTSKMLLRCQIVDGDVSMIGVSDDILDDTVFTPIPFIKILHNLNIEASL